MSHFSLDNVADEICINKRDGRLLLLDSGKEPQLFILPFKEMLEYNSFCVVMKISPLIKKHVLVVSL